MCVPTVALAKRAASGDELGLTLGALALSFLLKSCGGALGLLGLLWLGFIGAFAAPLAVAHLSDGFEESAGALTWPSSYLTPFSCNSFMPTVTCAAGLSALGEIALEGLRPLVDALPIALRDRLSFLDDV